MQLTPYQQRWICDESRHKVANKARRIGFSEIVALEDALDACGIDLVNGCAKPAADQLILSASEQHSKDLLARAGHHVRTIGSAIMASNLIEQDGVLRISLSNGKSLRAFAANPTAIRSYGGDVTLDEFAHHARDEEVWKAAQPCTQATLANPQGFRLKVISSPSGDTNKFYRLCETSEGDVFSKHVVDIHQAIADGFPAIWEEICAEYPDPDLRAQEFECSFMASDARYIDATAYDACVYDEIEDLGKHFYLCAAGFDVARRRHNAALVQLGKIGDVLYVVDVEARRGVSWSDMEEWVGQAVRKTQGKCAIDATGIGDQFAERMRAAYPMQIEGVTFTLKSKEALASGLKLAIDRQRIRVPRDLQLRRDVLALRRIVTPAQNVRYDAQETPDGHADLAWALALAIYAAGGTVLDVGDVRSPVDSGARRQAAGMAPRRGRLRSGLKHL